MKTLQSFINEQLKVNEEKSSSKTITFDFSDLDNAEDTLKSFEGKEGCSIDGNKLTISISNNNFDKLGSVQDILQQYYEGESHSQKHTSSESYANLVTSFGKQLNSFNDILDEFENADKEDDKKEEE